MRYVFLVLAVGCVLVAATAQARADGPVASGTTASNTTAAASDASASACENPNYRYCDGRRWYWMPARYWVYYDRGQWHRPASIASATTGEGPIPYTAGYRGPTETPTVAPAPRAVYYYRPANTGTSDFSFGTHGHAVSFGF